MKKVILCTGGTGGHIFPMIALYEELKKNHNVTILQSGRWEKMLEDRIGYGEKNDLTEKFVYDFFKAIHAESINKQSKIMND